MLKRQKIYIIDGYNVLRQCDCYKHLVGDAPNFKDWTTDVFNAARDALLDDCFRFADKNSYIVIVYDAFNNSQDKFNDESVKNKNVEVVFTKYKETADTRIQNICRKMRDKGLDVIVVTSDLQIQNATINKNVVRMSAREFELYIHNENQEVDKSLNALNNHNKKSKDTTSSNISSNIFKSKLEDVVDEDTAKKLLQLRNSL